MAAARAWIQSKKNRSDSQGTTYVEQDIKLNSLITSFHPTVLRGVRTLCTFK